MCIPRYPILCGILHFPHCLESKTHSDSLYPFPRTFSYLIAIPLVWEIGPRWWSSQYTTTPRGNFCHFMKDPAMQLFPPCWPWPWSSWFRAAVTTHKALTRSRLKSRWASLHFHLEGIGQDRRPMAFLRSLDDTSSGAWTLVWGETLQ